MDASAQQSQAEQEDKVTLLRSDYDAMLSELEEYRQRFGPLTAQQEMVEILQTLASIAINEEITTELSVIETQAPSSREIFAILESDEQTLQASNALDESRLALDTIRHYGFKRLKA